MAQTVAPTIEIYATETNSYTVHISGSDPIYYYIIRENGSIMTERYNITSEEYTYDVFYNGHVTETSEVTVQAQCYSMSGFESEETIKSYTVNYVSPYKKLDKPINFNCVLDTANNNLTYSFTMPYNLGIYGYSVEYSVSDSLSPLNNIWYTIEDNPLNTTANGGELITGSTTYNFAKNNKYTLVRVYLWGGSDELHSDYAYYSLPKHFPYQTQLLNTDGARPCLTRTYRDGQWRQCRIQYYKLLPLIAQPLDEVIYDVQGNPIYVAKNETAAVDSK
jgi:hypothetical protein